MENEDFDGLRDLMHAHLVEEGLDPDIVLPLMDLLSQATIDGATAKIAMDNGEDVGPMAAIHYGRVAGIMEAMVTIHIPVPVARPSDALRIAELAILDPEGYAEMVAESGPGYTEEEADDGNV